jgi:hypothetical protein
VSTRPTAGQASLEYVAALALIAAVFAVAAPAVGAPDIPKLVVGKLRLGICLVANDVCSDAAAKAAGLAPCPLSSELRGHEVSVTAYSIEIGHRLTLTVTPQSDGSVTVVRSAGGHAGGSGGPPGASLALGPVTFDAGPQAGVRGRVTGAKAWHFADQATADRFVEHALLNTFDDRDFPPAWYSVESGQEASAMVGLAAGAKGWRDRGLLVGLGASGDEALGARLDRDGLVTLYGRFGWDAEVSLPFVPSPLGHGREEWVVEYTFGRAGPREIAFRRGDASDGGKRVSETVMRLDLREPANLAVARPLIDTRLPWPPDIRARVEAVLRRIATDGTVERAISEVDDRSWGASGSVRGGLEFGAGGKRIKVHRKLVEATARTGGPYERERFDCQP